MIKPFISFYRILFLIAFVGCSCAVYGQTRIDKAPEIAEDAPQVQKPAARKPLFQLAETLDGLFAQLKRTGDEKRAQYISDAIWENWLNADSHLVDLLMGWAKRAMHEQDYAKALDILDQIIVLRPSYAEGFNQRATVHYMMRHYKKSMADIESTLALEPRHYGALSGLATIFEILGYRKKALQTWYKVLEIYPVMKSAQNAAARLESELAGNQI